MWNEPLRLPFPCPAAASPLCPSQPSALETPPLLAQRDSFIPASRSPESHGQLQQLPCLGLTASPCTSVRICHAARQGRLPVLVQKQTHLQLSAWESSAGPGLPSQLSSASSGAPGPAFPSASSGWRHKELYSHAPGSATAGEQLETAGTESGQAGGPGCRPCCFKEQKAPCKPPEIHLLFSLRSEVARPWPGSGEGHSHTEQEQRTALAPSLLLAELTAQCNSSLGSLAPPTPCARWKDQRTLPDRLCSTWMLSKCFSSA